MSLPAPLMFTVGLIDQITKPIAKISNKLNGLAANYQAGTMQMATGVGGIAASGYALQNALMPAIEMDRALGEVASLGVRDSALKMLTQNSYDYALKYGESAVDFVRSSYDIQSAITGLNDSDLSRFTMASNVLAKATKADAATVTNYMGTMYGIFKNDAKNMGEGAWIERVTGMTATAVQAFKTDGKKMSDAFAALGASAGLAPLEEQMAIMGTLQATMQGSESATKYKAFLAGVGKAQKALNLQFADANGNMLPMVDILNKIKGKYGETISVAESDQLATAFGSQEAVSLVKLLLKDVDGLTGSIDQLGKVNGMQQAEKMAASMTDQSHRLTQSWFVIRAAFGAAVLPAFNEFVGKLAEMGGAVMRFADKFPNITRWLGYFGIGLLLAVAAGGMLTLMLGAGKMALVTWKLGADAASWAGTKFAAVMKTMRAWTLAVNIAMAANPIGFLIAGIALAIVAVAAIIYYWDELKATISEWGWIKAVGKFFGEMITGIQNEFISFYNWIAGKLNTLPGVDIELKQIVGPVDTQKLQNATKLPENMPSQQAMPEWMQRQAANDVAGFSVVMPAQSSNIKPNSFVPEKLNQQLNVQRNLPAPYKPETLTQQQHLQLVKPAAYVPEQLNQQLSVQRNLPAPYKPEKLQQQVDIKPVASDMLASTITPKYDQQAAASAQASRKASQSVNTGKTISFGDVIVQNPPKEWSLAELADQQELRTA